MRTQTELHKDLDLLDEVAETLRDYVRFSNRPEDKVLLQKVLDRILDKTISQPSPTWGDHPPGGSAA